MASKRNTQYESTNSVIISADDARDWLTWPGRQNAPSIVGITKARFAEFLVTGKIVEYICPDKSKRYSPEDLRVLADEIAFEPPAEDETRSKIGGIAVDSAQATVDLLKQYQAHTERLIDVMIKSSEKSQGALLSAIEYQSKHIDMLQKTHTEAIRSRDSAKVEEIAATVEAECQLAKESRRTALTEAVVPYLGPTLQNLTAGLAEVTAKLRGVVSAQPAQMETQESASDPANPDESKSPEEMVSSSEGKAIGLLRSVGREKLALLEASGLLDENQSATLAELLSELG